MLKCLLALVEFLAPTASGQQGLLSLVELYSSH